MTTFAGSQFSASKATSAKPETAIPNDGTTETQQKNYQKIKFHYL
jgi:hypothetical protein